MASGHNKLRERILETLDRIGEERPYQGYTFLSTGSGVDKKKTAKQQAYLNFLRKYKADHPEMDGKTQQKEASKEWAKLKEKKEKAIKNKGKLNKIKKIEKQPVKRAGKRKIKRRLHFEMTKDLQEALFTVRKAYFNKQVPKEIIDEFLDRKIQSWGLFMRTYTPIYKNDPTHKTRELMRKAYLKMISEKEKLDKGQNPTKKQMEEVEKAIDKISDPVIKVEKQALEKGEVIASEIKLINKLEKQIEELKSDIPAPPPLPSLAQFKEGKKMKEPYKNRSLLDELRDRADETSRRNTSLDSMMSLLKRKPAEDPFKEELRDRASKRKSEGIDKIEEKYRKQQSQIGRVLEDEKQLEKIVELLEGEGIIIGGKPRPIPRGYRYVDRPEHYKVPRAKKEKVVRPQKYNHKGGDFDNEMLRNKLIDILERRIK